ncbi:MULTISPECIES: hypothetical protein [Thermococcus]|nr:MULTISPECIES: hypothetical protein [Thermococcus]
MEKVENKQKTKILALEIDEEFDVEINTKVNGDEGYCKDLMF